MNTKCASCDSGFCIGGYDKKKERSFTGCHEASLRMNGSVGTDQPLCRCFYDSPAKHGFERFEWPQEVINVMNSGKSKPI